MSTWMPIHLHDICWSYKNYTIYIYTYAPKQFRTSSTSKIAQKLGTEKDLVFKNDLENRWILRDHPSPQPPRRRQFSLALCCQCWMYRAGAGTVETRGAGLDPGGSCLGPWFWIIWISMGIFRRENHNAKKTTRFCIHGCFI